MLNPYRPESLGGHDYEVIYALTDNNIGRLYAGKSPHALIGLSIPILQVMTQVKDRLSHGNFHREDATYPLGIQKLDFYQDDTLVSEHIFYYIGHKIGDYKEHITHHKGKKRMLERIWRVRNPYEIQSSMPIASGLDLQTSLTLPYSQGNRNSIYRQFEVADTSHRLNDFFLNPNISGTNHETYVTLQPDLQESRLVSSIPTANCLWKIDINHNPTMAIQHHFNSPKGQRTNLVEQTELPSPPSISRLTLYTAYNESGNPTSYLSVGQNSKGLLISTELTTIESGKIADTKKCTLQWRNAQGIIVK